MTRDERELVKAGFSLDDIHFDEYYIFDLIDESKPKNFDSLPPPKQRADIARRVKLILAAERAQEYRRTHPLKRSDEQ